tara:strand:- start:618 stop:2900 length:2283 start_codon:yes stop_codon:yes gene_type:complete
MSEILQEIIVDENLVWDKNLENKPEKFFVKLSTKSIDELKRNRAELNLNKQGFPELKNEINQLKTEKILQGVGLLIIDGKSFSSFSKDEVIKIYEMICGILGTLYIQNIKSEKIVEIKDAGKSMTSGGRYHQTKEGGSYHTDSPHWTNVPDLVGLLCINKAKKGGISKFVSAYTIHNQLLKEQANGLKILYENFHFDKRGEFKINESQTVFEPVFEFKDDKLHCRFLNDYIIAGHEIQNNPLSKLQKTSLQSLEEISKNENNVLSYDLKPGDIVFFDNHRILHGRTMFEDYEDESRKRHLLRTWIKFDSSGMKKPEHVRFGRYFLGLINDLKRRPEDAAKELNISLEHMMDLLEGRKEISSEIISRAKKIWPVSSRDFFLIEDDCPNGVKIMHAEDSARSSRIMERGGSPYYEYRDTVMSGGAPFRPEWIKELFYVNDNDPNNRTVKWNNGHFMHQFTYFIGDVNFYYIDDNGKKQTAVMKTGDSMYITPFIPHTFATRKGAKKNGLILALTYGDKLVGEIKQELASLSTELAAQFSLDFSTKENASASLIKFHRQISNLTINEVSRRTKISIETIRELESGNCLPSEKEIVLLANAFTINTRELIPNDKIERKVVVKSHEECERWYYPEESKIYEFTALASTSSLPFSKAFEIKVQNSSNPDFDLKVGLHQYIYNVGNSELFLNWELDGEKYCELIKPGDSVYIKPFIKHNFRGDGNLVALRIGGKIPGDSQRELSILGRRNVSRAISETKLWFNPDRK